MLFRQIDPFLRLSRLHGTSIEHVIHVGHGGVGSWRRKGHPVGTGLGDSSGARSDPIA